MDDPNRLKALVASARFNFDGFGQPHRLIAHDFMRLCGPVVSALEEIEARLAHMESRLAKIERRESE